MHIVVMADSIDNQNAGVHFYLKNLIEALGKIDQKNKYTFIHNRKNPFFEGKDHVIVPRKRGLGMESVRRLIKIPRVIKKINPDLVWEPCHIGLLNLPKHIKKVLTIHDLTPLIFPHFHTTRSVIIHKLFLKKVFKIADLILTPSEKTKADIEKLYQAKAKIAVTQLGIDSVVEKNKGGSKPINEPYILYLGTIEPRKNLEMLIDIFRELKVSHHLPHKLVLAGDIGWKSENIMSKTKDPDIIVTGYLSEEEKANWYRNAEMFVYPSIYEGFGLPPLEAMNYGLPVICSKGGSLKELFEDYSLSFEPEDRESLKAHILKLSGDDSLRKKMGEKGQEYAGNFKWENTARKTLEAMEGL